MATSSEMKMKASKSKSVSSLKIPIYIVEDHDEALQYIYRQIASKKLPFHNNTLIHFDAHPDLLIPTSLQADEVYNKHLLFSRLSIENWIMPAVYAGHISTVLWLKPPWSQQFVDGTVQFYVGKHKKTGLIKVSCTESYFLAELLYAPEDDLVDRKPLTLHVVTISPGKSTSVVGNSASGDNSQDIQEPKNRTHAVTLIDDGRDKCENKTSSANASYSAVASMPILSGNESSSYILDIDLDFFSTGNPFVDVYSKEEYNSLRKLYAYMEPVDSSLEAVQRCTEDRCTQLTYLKNVFASLQNGENVQFTTSERDVTLQELVTSLRQRDKIVDFNWLHEVGSSCDDTELPDHISSKKEIGDLVVAVKQFLVSLPYPPCVITVARSSDDDYCPRCQVDDIQRATVDMLTAVYPDTQIYLKYSSQETSARDNNCLGDAEMTNCDT